MVLLSRTLSLPSLLTLLFLLITALLLLSCLSCVSGGGGSVPVQCFPEAARAAASALELTQCVQRARPTPTTPVPTSTPSTPTPSPTATAFSWTPLPPQIDMSTSGQPATASIEITQHYRVHPSLISPLILPEMPDPSLYPDFWQMRYLGHQGAKNCDTDHFYAPDGSRTVMWWVCGGSVRFSSEPRDWDVGRPSQPFHVSCSPPSLLLSYPAWGSWYSISVGPGPGSCTVCIPPGATTSDGLVVPVSSPCGTWPVL